MNTANYEGDYIFRLYVAVFAVDLMSEHGQAFHNKPSSAEDRRRLIEVFVECLERLEFMGRRRR
jgi:hypothetical protein